MVIRPQTVEAGDQPARTDPRAKLRPAKRQAPHSGRQVAHPKNLKPEDKKWLEQNGWHWDEENGWWGFNVF